MLISIEVSFKVLTRFTDGNFRNAGFDPATFRVDQYGNVLYYHADPASPLAWNIDHWFPCSSNTPICPHLIYINQNFIYLSI